MKVVYERCAGLDVHKKTVVACVRIEEYQETRTFGTMTDELLVLSDWLTEQAVTHVAMESTGEFWKPIFNLLEGNFEVLLVNAQHLKQVPGRKTDVSDAQWIAELLQVGLLKASFIPPIGQRELRDLTRYRNSFIRERVNLVNRVQKLLEDANIKLAAVASSVMGVSGRAMLDALAEGQDSPDMMADLAQGRLRQKRDQLTKALTGRMREHHRFVLTELLCQIDSLDETIAHFTTEIQRRCIPYENAVIWLDSIPGVARTAAEMIVAEIGIDMHRFPSADHLASWAGVVPGNYESAGKRLSARARQGNRVLRTVLVQAAHAASRTRNTYLAAQYHRLAARRGKKKAILAVAHSILVIAYHLILRQEPYRELGADYFDKIRPEQKAKRHIRELERLGFSVVIQSKPGEIAA
jgi:transposase